MTWVHVEMKTDWKHFGNTGITTTVHINIRNIVQSNKTHAHYLNHLIQLSVYLSSWALTAKRFHYLLLFIIRRKHEIYVFNWQ